MLHLVLSSRNLLARLRTTDRFQSTQDAKIPLLRETHPNQLVLSTTDCLADFCSPPIGKRLFSSVVLQSLMRILAVCVFAVVLHVTCVLLASSKRTKQEGQRLA